MQNATCYNTLDQLILPTKFQCPAMPRTGLKVCVIVGGVKTDFSDQLLAQLKAFVLGILAKLNNNKGNFTQ